jgi:hypothetical protein
VKAHREKKERRKDNKEVIGWGLFRPNPQEVAGDYSAME